MIFCDGDLDDDPSPLDHLCHGPRFQVGTSAASLSFPTHLKIICTLVEIFLKNTNTSNLVNKKGIYIMRRGDLQLIVQLSCFKFGYTKLRKTAGQSASLSEEVEVHLAILVMAWHSLANRDLLLDHQRPQHSLRAQKLFWEYWRIGSS